MYWEMYYDGTGHYFRTTKGGTWRPLEENTAEVMVEPEYTKELLALQDLWYEKYGVDVEPSTILSMLEDAENVSVRYEVGEDF
ncbi:hypothetical protein HN803_06920 [candidate division WWE3 bacterium]|jgi:hypothetical protein|nr:hypothetical protein [candidate division WWE3 bacterium]